MICACNDNVNNIYNTNKVWHCLYIFLCMCIIYTPPPKPFQLNMIEPSYMNCLLFLLLFFPKKKNCNNNNNNNMISFKQKENMNTSE